MSAQQGESPLNHQDWAAASGQRWLDHLPQFESMLAPIGARVIAAAALKPGERVVDVGCGGGPTTLDIAQVLGPAGCAVGVDLAPMLVTAARDRAARERRAEAAPVKFVCGDAATLALDDAPFDVLFSRFGVMFFDDPAAAFTNMRRWLKPSGRLAFSCWAPPTENPWLLDVQAILGRYVETPPPDPLAPGPFALADVNRIRDVLGRAGFSGVNIDVWRGAQAVGGAGATPAKAADFAMTAMHVGQMLEDEPDSVKAQARAEIEVLFAKHAKGEGVMLPSTAWIVTAKA